MNLYFYIILGVLIAKYLLDLVADLLNLRHPQGQVPDFVREHYDESAYAKTRAYQRDLTRFGIASASFDLAVLLGFWFGGGFAALDVWLRGFGWHIIITGLAYIGILAAAKSFLDLPWQIYHTFVIEARYGFNQTTWRVFVMDRIKGTLLGALIGVPLLAGILALFQYAGPAAWLYVWGTTTIVSLFISFIAPVWIMPLFNKFQPLPPGELRDEIVAYAERVHFPLRDILVMDGSKRSRKANAFFTGLGRNKRIALFDTLIANHTVAELIGVLAHEIGHYKRKHILQMMGIGIAQTGILFYCLSLFLHEQGLFAAFFVESPAVYTGLLFFGLLYTPLDFILNLFSHALSRRFERQADRFAVETGTDKKSYIAGLVKLSRDHLSNLWPHPLYVFLHHSHPPVLERIRQL